MPEEGKRWRHVIISTLNSWLPGDPRGFRTVVPEECVSDKHESPHFANLYDMAVKYADVVPVAEVIAHLRVFEGPN